MIPVLLTTYNRLEYTKKAIAAAKGTCDLFVFDNGSTDGTVSWLASQELNCVFSKKNLGVAGAMNAFLQVVQDEDFAGKIDNDTIVTPFWAERLREIAYQYGLDVVQAKHYVIPRVHEKGWPGLMSTCKQIGPGVYESNFVGGAGIIFKPSKITTIELTDWKLLGWNKWQLKHLDVRKAFYEGVEVKLLDEHGYSDYPDYYKETQRL